MPQLQTGLEMAVFPGTPDGDVFFGTEGDDVFTASTGIDHIFGGGGRDALHLSGKRSDYSVVYSYDSLFGGSATIRDLRPNMPGSAYLTSDVELFVFADQTLDITKPVVPTPTPDFPDVPTNFAPWSVRLTKAGVSENAPAGTLVGKLSGFDPDGDPLTFKIVSDATGAFRIKGDKLVTSRPLDYETARKHAITIEVSDGRGGTNKTDFTIVVGDKLDVLKGTGRADVLKGASGRDMLDGLAGNDKLNGMGGKDTLIGGAGKDILTGGTGADQFVFKAVTDSKVAARDVITDFSVREHDKIDLRAIDANTKVAGNQAFSWIGLKEFSGKAGELRYEKVKSDTVIYADINGDKKADMAIELDGALTLNKGYFFL